MSGKILKRHSQIWSYVISFILYSLGNASDVTHKATNQDDRILISNHTYAKVIGGTFVPIDEYPWFARATSNNGNQWFGCGGSLVSPSFVITAAHCIVNDFEQSGGYDVGSRCYGSADKNNDNCGQSGNEYRKVAWVWKDPNHNKGIEGNWDYALVRLSSPINSIEPVAMNANSAIPSGGEDVIGMGFGATDVNGNGKSLKLLHVTVDAFTPAACKRKWGNNAISPQMLCAVRKGKDICHGDSGGPLITESEPHQLIGLSSFVGDECADLEAPGVYARVSARYTKLKEVICDNTPSSHPKASFCPGGPPPTNPPAGSPVSAPVSAPVTFEPTPQMSEFSIEPTPDSSQTAQPTAQPTFPPTKGRECKRKQKLLTVEVKTDNKPKATRLTVKRRNKDNVFKKNIVKGINFGKNKVTILTGCVNTNYSCYRLKITDKQENGIQNGYIKMFYRGKEIYSNKFNSGANRVKKFGACDKNNN